MSEAPDKDEKQFDASEQKLRQAREKGDIPRSPEVNSALMYLGGLVSVGFAAPLLVSYWLPMGARAFGSDPLGFAPQVFDLAAGVWQFASLAVIGVLALPALLILAGLAIQRSIVFSPQKLKPDIKRINPIKNAGQKFGKSGLVTYLISVAKAACVGISVWFLFRALWHRLAAAGFSHETQWVSGLGEILFQVLMLALAISVLFGTLDWFWKRHEFLTRNRMTLKEVKDEYKNSEGDPHMKQARRQKAVDLVLNQMLNDVETADVVIVNPTHYAVALKWNRGSGRAPVCVAKGVDETAARIRERANGHDVPIWSDPPAARALHATIKVGDEIQAEHFAAVAIAIRFAEAMREKMRKGW